MPEEDEENPNECKQCMAQSSRGGPHGRSTRQKFTVNNDRPTPSTRSLQTNVAHSTHEPVSWKDTICLNHDFPSHFCTSVAYDETKVTRYARHLSQFRLINTPTSSFDGKEHLLGQEPGGGAELSRVI